MDKRWIISVFLLCIYFSSWLNCLLFEFRVMGWQFLGVGLTSLLEEPSLLLLYSFLCFLRPLCLCFCCLWSPLFLSFSSFLRFFFVFLISFSCSNCKIDSLSIRFPSLPYTLLITICKLAVVQYWACLSLSFLVACFFESLPRSVKKLVFYFVKPWPSEVCLVTFPPEFCGNEKLLELFLAELIWKLFTLLASSPPLFWSRSSQLPNPPDSFSRSLGLRLLKK